MHQNWSLPDYPADTGTGLWLRLVMTLNVVSLGIDGVDVVRYLRGERAELI